MGRFNTKAQTNKKSSAIQSTGETATNHYGTVGYKRDQKSELYLLAISFMGGDSNFYESSDQRYARLIALAREVAVLDPEWMANFIPWLRDEAQMRTAPGVIAVEALVARLEFMKTVGDEKTITSQGTIHRRFIDAACARADEPGEILAYYLTKYGKPLPYSLKKGLGDAATRLYTERGYLRWAATTTSSVGMADVIRLCRPKPRTVEQSHLFNYITEWEHRGSSSESALAELQYLPKVQARRTLMDVAPDRRRDFMVGVPGTLKTAEMGWQNISSWLGEMNKEAWEAVIPNMGLMALLRNLRNFDQVGISDEFAQEHIISKIISLNEIKKARVLPMRFLSAYRNAPSMRWSYPLELGLNYCLGNVPELGGRNLILVDVSPSMTFGRISDRSDLTYYDAATIFGAVLAVRNPDSELVQFGGSSKAVPVKRGESVLKVIEKFHQVSYTDIPAAVRQWYGNQDRVIIITDEQSNGWGGGGSRYAEFMQIMTRVRGIVPVKTPVYTWNLAGFEVGHQPSNVDNMHVFGGGFSDASFGTIEHIESGSKGTWPWEGTN